jgi:hypothetical protein
VKKRYGSDASKDISEKVFQFSKLPDMCTACQKAFDKKDKDMVQSWNVVVKQEVVRLFCPDCIAKTKDALNKLEENHADHETQ